jgi:hypothetical protein
LIAHISRINIQGNQASACTFCLNREKQYE